MLQSANASWFFATQAGEASARRREFRDGAASPASAAANSPPSGIFSSAATGGTFTDGKAADGAA